MNGYQSISRPKGHRRWLLWSLILIFLTTLTTFTILEVRSLNSEEPSVIRIILNTISRQNERADLGENHQSNKFVLVNLDNVQEDEEDLVKAIVTQVEENNSELDRTIREATNNKTSEENKNSYYEEQTPVLVYSKTDSDPPPLAYRQTAPIPYKQGVREEQPYYDGAGEDNGDYANDEGGYYHPQYEDDSREDFPPPQGYGNVHDSDGGRSTQHRQYDAYYRQWHYATPAPPTASSSRSASLSSPAATVSQGIRKSSAMTAATTMGAGGMRDPYAAYMDDYDYRPTHRLAPRPPYYQHQQQVQRYRPQASTQAVQKKENEGQEMNFLSILKTLKMMWDLYQSFANAWNSMAEKRNKEEELAKQKYKQEQQKLRINSKKPPSISSKNKPENPNKNSKNAKQTTKGPTTTTTTEQSISASVEEEEGEGPGGEDVDVTVVKPQKLQKAKVEPRKGSKGDKTPTKNAEGLRKKRQTKDDKPAESTEVGEGRYIKGDPLKGYYDFVITEGSYKFWAAFQVGTALLIIYSTFAAIYYSKVNPLVSDYDYTDYLGGARSLSGGDLDFVDDEATEPGDRTGVQQSKGWLAWLPRTGHSLKFILDAIDKLPVDHAVKGDAATDGGGAIEEVQEANDNDDDKNYDDDDDDDGDGDGDDYSGEPLSENTKNEAM